MPASRRILMLLGNYDTATHRGVARAAKDLNWHLNANMLTSFQIPSYWKGDGIICSLNNSKKLESFIRKSNLPTVDLSSWRTDLNYPRICGDNGQIGALAAEHFCSYGHRSFAWFCHQQNPVATARYQSFKRALTDKGFDAPQKLLGKKTQDYNSVNKWLKQLHTPTAIFAYNDNDAACLMNTCLAAGFQVPEDFAILGVDNNRLICEHMPVSLSSVNHDHERIGYEGAHLLDSIIKGKKPVKTMQYIQPTGITQRSSSDSHAFEDQIVRQVLDYMAAHLNRPIGTTEIASHLNISRRKIEIRFQKALQTSIHKKLMELRLKKAESLLVNGNEKIEHIAAVCGFSHAPHLCHAFKKAYNSTPLAYRNKEKNSSTS